MRVCLLRDYRDHRAGSSLVLPTSEGDWLISVGIACDPADFEARRNKVVDKATVEFGDPLRIDASVVDAGVRAARKAVRKKTALE